jgi:hypothetical protein
MSDSSNISVANDPVADQQVTDTQIADVGTSPVVDDSGHEAIDSSTSATQGTEDTQAEITRLRREAGKLKQVQQENAEYAKRFQGLESWAAKKPETLEEAMVAVGYTQEQAKAKIQELHTSGYWNQQAQQQIQNPVNIDPNYLESQFEAILQKKEMVKTNQDALQSLITTYPELDTTNLTDEQIEQKRPLIGTADVIARAKQAVFPNKPYKDLLIEAYGEITGKTAEQVSQARENGRLEGLAQAQAGNAAKTGVSLGSSQSSSTAKITEEHRNAAAMFGGNPEDYVNVRS